MPVKPPIYVWEHQFLPIDNEIFTEHHFQLLVSYIEKQNRKLSYLFDTSCRRGVNGILFKQYVGVITVKDLTIYVLPKADKDAKDAEGDKTLWQHRLTFMLSQVYKLKVQTTAPANLKWRPNVLLNIFLKKFLDEVAVLLNRGLIKTYRKTDGNRTALKGKLLFNKQIAVNCVHQERFYVRYTTYDYNHILNRIIRQALLAICDITNSSDIKGRATSTLFNFPELDEIAVTPELFSRLIFDRKSEDYRNVIKLAEMILLNYSPDLHHGNNHVWTLMFDMNKLWEEFVFVTLRRKLIGCTVSAQKQKTLWESDNNRKTVRADIVVEKGSDVFVLDTKWKMPRYDGKIVPSDADLHQMYVYLDVYGDNSTGEESGKAQKVALLYPGQLSEVKGEFVIKPANSAPTTKAQCDMLFLPGENYSPKSTNKTECREWQEAMANRISTWLES